jgi:hypothetical protein
MQSFIHQYRMSKDVESFWRWGCVEDALGSVVIGVKGGSHLRLAITKFFEHGLHGACMFSTDVDTASFGFCGGGYHVLDCLAEDVDGAIDLVTVKPTKVIVDSCSAACLGLDEVGLT